MRTPPWLRRRGGRRGGTRSGGGESGQLLVLTLGYVILCLLVASVVVAVSTVYIEHKKLLSVADGAAQAAADSFTLADTTQGPSPPAASLTGERVTASVNTYLVRDAARARFRDLEVVGATGSADGRSAQVSLAATARPPIVGLIVPEGVRIEASSTARARLTR